MKSRALSKASIARASNDAKGPEDMRDAILRLKRETVVAAAVELFYTQGYAKTTLDQIADAIHVTKPFIYVHFASKADLLAEICMRGTRLSHESILRAMSMGGSPTQRLATIARDFMETVLSHRAHAVIYSREELELAPDDRAAINKLRRDFDHHLIAVLEDGIAQGEFTVEDVPLSALAIVGIVGWSQMWYRPNGRLNKEEAAQRVASLVLSMVRAKLPA